MDTASGNNKICERSNPEMCVMLYSTAPSAAEESAQSDFPHGCSGADHRPWLRRQRQTSTEAALDALRDGYEVDPVVDAVGGTSLEAHRTA